MRVQADDLRRSERLITYETATRARRAREAARLEGRQFSDWLRRVISDAADKTLRYAGKNGTGRRQARQD